MESADQTLPKKQRNWRSISLRAMLGLVLVVGIPTGWWAGQAHQQRKAVERIEAVNGSVVYQHEVLDPNGKTSLEAEIRVVLMTLKASGVKLPPQKAPSTPPPISSVEAWKQWIRNKLGVEYIDTVAHISAVGSDRIGDEDLALLVDLPGLERLNLGNTSVGDAGSAHIGKLVQLKALYLYSTKITDRGLVNLQGLVQLEELGLAHNGDVISDAGLVCLSDLRKLRVLEIGGPKITDVSLQFLESLPELEQVLLIDAPNVSKRGLTRLQTTKPKLKIVQTRTR